MQVVFIDAERTGYEPNQVYETMTVGELAEVFTKIAKYEGEDTKVYLRHDNGYTFGGITNEHINVEDTEED